MTIGVTNLNGKDFLLDFSEHSLERSDQRFEDIDINQFLNTLNKLAQQSFQFGRYDEPLVVRDYCNNKVLVYSLSKTDEFDFERLEEALDFEDKVCIITLFHNAYTFKQNPKHRVIIIDKNNNFLNDEAAIAYEEYLEWINK